MTAYTYQFKIVSSVIMTIRASKKIFLGRTKPIWGP